MLAVALCAAAAAVAGLTWVSDRNHVSTQTGGRTARGVILIIAAVVIATLTVTNGSSYLVSLVAIACAVLFVIECYSHRFRYTYICSAQSCLVIALSQWSVPAATFAATVCTGQMWLTSGIQKLRSESFRTGLPIRDMVLFGYAESRGGNKEFLLNRVFQPLLLSPRRLFWRTLAMLTIIMEFALGLMIPLRFLPLGTIVLVIFMHVAFTVLAPIRILPFTLSSISLTLIAIGMEL